MQKLLLFLGCSLVNLEVFEGLLPKGLNIHATTAANAEERFLRRMFIFRVSQVQDFTVGKFGYGRVKFLEDAVDVAPCMSHYSLFSFNENEGVLLPNVMGFLGLVSRKLLLGRPHQFGTICFSKVLCKKTPSLSG